MLYGVDIVTTANELGHANAMTTANIYAHQITMAKGQKEAAEILQPQSVDKPQFCVKQNWGLF